MNSLAKKRKEINKDDVNVMLLNRWEVVANFINQHHGGTRTAKEVLAHAKDMQQSDFSRSSMKEAVNKAAFNKFEKDQKGSKAEEAQPSERYESNNSFLVTSFTSLF